MENGCKRSECGSNAPLAGLQPAAFPEGSLQEPGQGIVGRWSSKKITGKHRSRKASGENRTRLAGLEAQSLTSRPRSQEKATTGTCVRFSPVPGARIAIYALAAKWTHSELNRVLPGANRSSSHLDHGPETKPDRRAGHRPRDLRLVKTMLFQTELRDGHGTGGNRTHPHNPYQGSPFNQSCLSRHVPGPIRTDDLQLRKPLHYPTVLREHEGDRRESNPRYWSHNPALYH